MRFEWDTQKNRDNIAKHGIRFEDAARIFEGPIVSLVDERDDYGEAREISIGMIDAIAVVTVVHTDRNGRVRIISARSATRVERYRYEETLRQSFDPGSDRDP